MKESTFWKIFCTAVVGVVVVVPCMVYLEEPKKTEYDIIQSIIENLPDYQAEIESWGYQVSVLHRIEEEPPEWSFKHYYWNHASQVLVLTDKSGGNWCFYYGFDQFFTQFTSVGMTKLRYSDEVVEANKTVDLQIYKRNASKPPLRDNTKESRTQPYYDVAVYMQIWAYSAGNGEELSTYDGWLHSCHYCSGDFSEGWLGENSFVDMEKKARYANRIIKNEISEEQLLSYYRQGLDLQDRLMQLYYDKQKD